MLFYGLWLLVGHTPAPVHILEESCQQGAADAMISTAEGTGDQAQGCQGIDGYHGRGGHEVA